MINLNKRKINEKLLKFNYNFNVFYLMQLVARNYFKNYGAIFTDYILPIIVMSILFNVLDAEFVRVILPGIIVAPLISSGFISFAMGFFQWKHSIIYKKIKISQISTIQFFFSFFLFYFLASLLSFAFSLFFVTFLKLVGLENLKYFFDDVKSINWGIAILAIFLLIAIAIFLGIIMAFLVTSFNAIIAFGLTVFLVSAFLLGCYLSLRMVVRNEYMYKISWATPFYSAIRIFQIAWLQNAEYTIPAQQMGGVPVLVNANNETIFFENFANIDLNDDAIKIKANSWLYNEGREPWPLFAKEFEQIKSEGGKIVWKHSWNFNLIKNYEILSIKTDLFQSPSLLQYDDVHFHKSYWSAFLLGLGWIVVLSGIVSYLNFYKKK